MASNSFRSTLLLFLLYSLHVITTVNTLTYSTATLCHDHERSALLHFKQSISLSKSASRDFSAYPKTKSWKARECCSWHGVECNDNTGYVIGLHLNSSLLYGTFPSNSTIFSLVHLQILNLADNNFTYSPIPIEIAHLSSLSGLNLSHSDFSGLIPLELSGLSKLTSLDLSLNDLYGDFPIDIFHLPDLLVLDVGYNLGLTGFLPEFNHTSSFRELKLHDTRFSGNLPVSIGNLQSLTVLDICFTNFSGSIPTSIGNLTQLTYLSLCLNNFSFGKLSWLDKLTKLTLLDLISSNQYGDIPSMANLTQLTSLWLDYNSFSGEIPLWLMNMTELTELTLSHNELTGPIPSSFSQLKNLETLYLDYNNLNGTVDVDIFLSLTKLTSLYLSLNNITLLTHHHINFTRPKLRLLELNFCNLREIPYFLQFQNNLEYLLLRGSNLHGKIPHWLWNASDHLEVLDLSSNFLTAMEQNPIALPSKSLRRISLSNNLLQGNLPIPPPNTFEYSVSNNSLTGHIPPMICGVMSLKILDLSTNSMSGPIPQCLGNSLEILILQDNNFSGTIPQTHPHECVLQQMDLSQNQFTGIVPKSLSNCKMLQILDLSNNQIEQTFPIWLGTLPGLQILLLYSNKFYGAIGSPKIPSEFPMLRIIDLSHNSLTGDLPMEYIQIWNAMKVFGSGRDLYINKDVSLFFIASMPVPYPSLMTLWNKGVKLNYEKIPKNFTAIDLSSNKFTGKIPESFGSLEALMLLSLSNNELTGPIPPSLGNLRQLESLDLSHNNLSGIIPQQLAAQLIFLAFFNVSYNLLSGHIPQGQQFQTFDNSSYMANSGLCGFPISRNCGTVQSPPANDDEDDEFPSGFDWIFILAGLGSGIIVGFVMGNILMDRHPRLIGMIIRTFRGTQKKGRRGRSF